jgi:hypothetical protein
MNFGFKTLEILAVTSKLEGEVNLLGLELKQVYDDKVKAIAEKRFEDAARFREKEVELANKIETLLGVSDK